MLYYQCYTHATNAGYLQLNATEESSLRVHGFLFLSVILSLTACAGNRAVTDKNSTAEFVEISNPGYTMSPGAPATIWVPKSAVENGPPRGSEAVKMAYESVRDSQKGAVTPQNPSPAVAAAPAVTVSAQSISAGMRNRVAVLDTAQNQLAIPFKEKLRILPSSPVIAIAPEAAADRLLSRDERAAYAVKAWQDLGVNVSLFVSAPDGLTSGRYLSVEMYDGMGAGLIGKVDAVIPAYDAKDPAGLSSAVASSISLLAERARDAIALFPWYAKVVAVEGGKIYINAGHEAGINMGQRLNVLRGGKVVQGLGFAPGSVVGVLEVSGFVGSNGATASVKDGVQLYLTDIIAVQ
jgi:hypothetical protein